LFYLVLRALDTVEDDMSVPNSVKLPLLRAFHEKLYEPGWTFTGSGPQEKDRAVLIEFDVIQKEFSLMGKHYQDVIANVTRKMGAGMADFAALATPELPVAEVNSIHDYDLYCHYVAGLVGEGLSGLFASSGKERSFIADQLTLSNSMGLLLQKTNIYRDIKEDVDEGRGFWPRAIWGKYGFNSMKEICDPARIKEAQFTANDMVLDALRHATDALDYLTLLKNQSVFNFVAIPAVMAMATLECCFMNPLIFKQNVKIRKGQAVQIIMRSTNPREVAYMFRDYARAIHAKVPMDEPNLLKISIACGRIEKWAEHHYPSFLVIEPGQSGEPARTSVDPESTDARAPLYIDLVNKSRARADAERKQKFMDDLKARGILKDTTPVDQKTADEIMARHEADNAVPWVLLSSILVALLAIFGASIFGVIWYINKHPDYITVSSPNVYSQNND
jgi:farnesyl-diphosphate farnesyltransferase